MDNRIENKVIISNGLVTKTENWTLWNLEPWLTISFERGNDKEKFSLDISTPEGGGPPAVGSLTSVLKNLHVSFHKAYQELFALKDASEKKVHSIPHFKQYQVIVI